MTGGNDKAGMGEATAVLAVLGIVILEVVFTYARVPLDELYNVSVDGLAGGLGRALVVLNFPVALIAIPIALIAAGRIDRAPAWACAAVAVALSAIVAVPGVVDQSDLDARAVNALPAAGVALTTALVILAGRKTGFGFAPRRSWDPVRLAVAIVLLVGSVPWLLAEIGVSLAGVPVLGSIWLTDEPRLQPGHLTPGPAVHAGHHHGMDGVLLVWAAMALSRMTVKRLRWPISALLALMFTYGLANAGQDWWLEQVVKRGWTDAEAPNVLLPALTVGWSAVVLAAAALLWGAYAVTRPDRAPARSA